MNAENTTQQVEQMTAEAQKTIEEGVEKMTQGMEDMAEFGRQNMEAMVAASKRAAKAAEEMNAEVAAFAKKSYEDGMAAFKEISSAKSMNELVEKQSAFAQSAMEAYVAEASKLNDMMTGAAKDCVEPLTGRFQAAGEMMKASRP